MGAAIIWTNAHLPAISQGAWRIAKISVGLGIDFFATIGFMLWIATFVAPPQETYVLSYIWSNLCQPALVLWLCIQAWRLPLRLGRK